MISEEQIELLVERLIERINKSNEIFLRNIGSSIKEIKTLTPTQAQQLVQILKYGGNYDELVREIAKYTNMNIKDIDEIFSIYAEKDQMFYKRFYDYRNALFMPYQENMALRTQTMALANITKQAMYNFTRNNAIGYTINGTFYNLKDTYNKLLDEALLNVGQGKQAFDQAMSGILKDIGGSGLKYLDYESGRQIRLDSMVRMNLKDGLRNLHNEMQQIYGKEFDADMVEISVHSHPALDHLMQGHQFSIEEFNKLQNGEEAKDLNGKIYTLDHDGNGSFRPISMYNCYHTVFYGIIGVTKPEYTEEELQNIIDENEKGFEYENKHYSLYDGEQLLRKVELELRRSKDTQILARSSNNVELVGEMQSRITQLTDKYRDILKASGLKSKFERARVSGYKRVAKSKLK